MRAALLLTIFTAACNPGDDPSVLDTPDDTWTWVPFADTTCANGSPAGIGVYRTHASDDLFVYFQGGGVCWDHASCFVDKLAVHTETTYGPALLMSEVGLLAGVRDDPDHPLARATVVFVPYCTADIHSGAAVATYSGGDTTGTLHHTGATNTQAFVDALAAKFPAANTIVCFGDHREKYR